MRKSTIIYGPPGCGKSTEIISRMKAALSVGVPDDRIGLVSFTRAAARELADRAGVRTGNNIATLHSYAFRAVGAVRDQIVDRRKLREFSKESKIETTGATVYDEESLGDGDRYLSAYGLMRSTMTTDEEEAFRQSGSEGTLAGFSHFILAYERWKQAYGYLDFDDLIEKAMDQPAPDLDLLFLDEAQDFSPAQWALIERWTPHISEFVLALDDDQTLYRFTGADPLGGPNFEDRHGAERVVLDQSYRVPSEIHRLANEIIHRVRDRVDKQYLPVREGGSVVHHGGFGSVPTPDPKTSTLILFRNHGLRKEIEQWLRDEAIPYWTDGGKPGPFQGLVANAASAWEEAKRNVQRTGQIMLAGRKEHALYRLVKPQFRRVLSENPDRLVHLPWHKVLTIDSDERVFLLRVMGGLGNRDRWTQPETEIHLSTIHGAKGREADRVILLDSMSHLTAEAHSKDPDPETRAFYVAVTRARHRLDVVAGENQYGVPRL